MPKDTHFFLHGSLSTRGILVTHGLMSMAGTTKVPPRSQTSPASSQTHLFVHVCREYDMVPNKATVRANCFLEPKCKKSKRSIFFWMNIRFALLTVLSHHGQSQPSSIHHQPLSNLAWQFPLITVWIWDGLQYELLNYCLITDRPAWNHCI